MASTIIGTYPIINKQLSSIDDNGIQTLSYAFTVKTASAYDYIPSKDDEYYGPGNLTASSSTLFKPNLPSSTRSKYLVTSVNVDNINGGLTQIVVNTAGSQNIGSPAKVRILPNYPLIFGLSGISTTNAISYLGAGKPRAGYGIMATFITASTPEAEAVIFANYSNKIMPSVLIGSPMPTPARSPFLGFQFPVGTGGVQTNGFQSNYSGFVCTETALQRIGGVTLFQLVYQELGYYYDIICSNGKCETSYVYKFE
jgi:hypothetical protein